MDKRQREVLQLYYFQGLSYKEIGERLGVAGERVRQLLQYALRYLRHPKCGLASFREEFITTHAYHRTGWASFKESQASSVESVLERLEELDLRWQKWAEEPHKWS